MEERKVNPYKPPRMEGADKHSGLTFKLGKEVTKHVRWFLESRGWTVHEEQDKEDHFEGNGQWNLFWQDKRIDRHKVANARDNQRMNHLSNTKGIVRKDLLALNYMNLRDAYPETFNFHPETYLLTNIQSERFEAFVSAYYAKARKCAELKEQGVEDGSEMNLWISKPCASHRGKGIYVFSDIEELTNNIKASESDKNVNRGSIKTKRKSCMLQKSIVVQEYVQNPMLIKGYKSDIRMYVLVTSVTPFRCYLYSEVIARLSTKKYNLDQIDDVYSHLTNASINKKNKAPLSEEELKILGRGAKWDTKELMGYLDEEGYDTDKVWREIKRLVLCSLLPLVGKVESDPHLYEVLGFDVMLDNNGKPWLIEINRSPAMALSCYPDFAKTHMLTDLFNMLNMEHSILNQEHTGWEEACSTRDPGGWQLLFPFNQQCHQANERLVNATDANPIQYGRVLNARVDIASIPIWSEKSGEEGKLFFGEQEDGDDGRPTPPWRKRPTLDPCTVAAQEFRREVVPLIGIKYPQNPNGNYRKKDKAVEPAQAEDEAMTERNRGNE